MKQKTRTRIFITQIIIGGIIVLVGLALMVFNNNPIEKVVKTKCYDRLNNEIVGVDCKDTIYIYNSTFYTGMTLFVLGFFIMLFSQLWIINDFEEI